MSDGKKRKRQATRVRSLRIIGDLKPGDHLCCLYETEEEHRAVLTPFLRQGLEHGEKVVYIVDAHTAETVLGYLRDDGLDAESYLARGQLSLLTAEESYIREGVFEPDGMIALLRSETEQALAEGYSALRVSGEMTWALRGLPGSKRLIEYEARLNEFFPGSKCLAMCQYDRRRFAPKVLLGVLRTHPVVIIGTEILDNSHYIPPAELLGRDLPSARLGHWLEDLRERKQAREALTESEEKYRNLVENMPEVIYSVDMAGNITSVNEAVKTLFGFKPQEVIGRNVSEFIPEEVLAKAEEAFQQSDRADKLTAETIIVDKDGKPHDIEVSVVPIEGDGEVVEAQGIVRDITEQKKAEEALRESERRLSEQNLLLEEKNIALREVMGQLAAEKERLESQIQTNVDQLLLPLLAKAKGKGSQIGRAYIDLLEDNLKGLTSSFGIQISQEMFRLTQREIEICNMVRSGLTSKEIAYLLDVSHRTVQTHRNSIRRKLKLRRRKINLTTYLKTLSGPTVSNA